MENKGVDEIGIRCDTGQVVIRIDHRYFRPTEVGNITWWSIKAKEKLGWTPKISLEELVKEMVRFDKEEAKEALLKKKGFDVYGSIENPPNSIKN